MEGYACSDNMEEQPKEKVVEMVSIGVQCKFSAENSADAQVGTDDVRVKMVDVGIQTSPLPAFQYATCQTDASYGGVGSGGGFSGISFNDSAFANFHDGFDGLDDQFGDYASESSYDSCLDRFDCLEHLDNGNAYPENARHDDVMDQVDDQPEADQNEPVIYPSPPRNQVYTYHQFQSPESLGSKTTKNKHRWTTEYWKKKRLIFPHNWIVYAELLENWRL